MTKLEYSKRGLIGVLTPQANTTVEPEFSIMWPKGVSMVNARLISSKKTIEERLIDYTGQVEASLDKFANAPIRAVAFACTGASYLMGQGKEAELCERVHKNRGYPLVTAAHAVTNYLQTLFAKRIGLVSPYPPSLTEESVGYWESVGFVIAEVAAVFDDSSDFHPIYSLRAGSAMDAVNSLKDKNIDVIVMLGTGMPTLWSILNCADWDGPPVTSCMLSLAWRTMLHIDGKEASLDGVQAWSRGEDWRQRMLVHCL